ncbi:TIGR02147 family protein [Bdellovibrio sp. HCB290]|uniref:TIGR02147 family protein n=1 Tax=Bdellovibrio sp. HCB290 TaxID=3394356 RepID=UPI0039B440FE
MSKALNIFEFNDYRAFIKRWLEDAKTQKISNLTRLAEITQVHPTFLSHVLAGTKELSLEQAALISEHIGLTKIEQEYFFVIINLERAGNLKLKKYWQDKKSEIEVEKNRLSQRFEEHNELSNEQKAVFYSSWIYAAVWSSTAIENGQTSNQISERFRLTRSKAEDIISFLLQTGLCKESKGTFVMGDAHLHIPNESPLVVKHHTNWRMKSIQKMDNRENDELFFTAPMSISQKDFAVIREKLTASIKDIVEVAKDSSAEEVVCLNIDFFKTNT